MRLKPLNADNSQLSEYTTYMSQLIYPSDLFLIYTSGVNLSKNAQCMLRNLTIISVGPHHKSILIGLYTVYT